MRLKVSDGTVMVLVWPWHQRRMRLQALYCKPACINCASAEQSTNWQHQRCCAHDFYPPNRLQVPHHAAHGWGAFHRRHQGRAAHVRPGTCRPGGSHPASPVNCFLRRPFAILQACGIVRIYLDLGVRLGEFHQRHQGRAAPSAQAPAGLAAHTQRRV